MRGPVAAGTLIDSIHALDRDLPVGKVRTMQEIASQSVVLEQFVAQLVGIFAAFALTLTMIGAYSVIAYGVALRTQEFGIRVALGASRPDLRKLVLRQGLMLTGVTRMRSGMLFEVRPGDPLVFSAKALILAVVACWPAMCRPTAPRVNPMVALRYE